jgi:hypothetical protein
MQQRWLSVTLAPALALTLAAVSPVSVDARDVVW